MQLFAMRTKVFTEKFQTNKSKKFTPFMLINAWKELSCQQIKYKSFSISSGAVLIRVSKCIDNILYKVCSHCNCTMYVNTNS